MRTTLIMLASSSAMFGLCYAFGADVSQRGWELGMTLVMSGIGAVGGFIIDHATKKDEPNV